MRRLPEAIEQHLLALSLPEEPSVPRAYVHNDLGNALSDASGRQPEVRHHQSRASDLFEFLLTVSDSF